MAAVCCARQCRVAHFQVIPISVSSDNIFDLRDEQACLAAGIDINDATADWQEVVAGGGKPSSWAVRERIIELGGVGLIDPSRKAPGLWHLVLFDWNQNDTARVSIEPEKS